MAVWAYECRPCAASGVWFVARDRVDTWPQYVKVLRVKIGADWRCGIVDRSRPVQVEAMLLRESVLSDEHDCPECAAPQPAVAEVEAESRPTTPVTLKAAAISMAGVRMLVVLAPLHVVQNGGEADMLIADLRPRFGGIDMLLMGQDDDGTPHYHGKAELVTLLASVPVDRMPWKDYTLA